MLVKGGPGVNWVEMIWLKTSTPGMVVISDSDYNLLFVIYVSHYSSRSWWRHQMGTLTALLAFCAGNSPVTGEFPTQRPATQSFDVFFDLHLNKRLGKQSCGWWFETPSCPLWRHRNVMISFTDAYWRYHPQKSLEKICTKWEIYIMMDKLILPLPILISGAWNRIIVTIVWNPSLSAN